MNHQQRNYQNGKVKLLQILELEGENGKNQNFEILNFPKLIEIKQIRILRTNSEVNIGSFILLSKTKCLKALKINFFCQELNKDNYTFLANLDLKHKKIEKDLIIPITEKVIFFC